MAKYYEMQTKVDASENVSLSTTLQNLKSLQQTHPFRGWTRWKYTLLNIIKDINMEKCDEIPQKLEDSEI